MKSWIINLSAGALGGLLVFGLLWVNKPKEIVENNPSYARQVNAPSTWPTAGVDFVEAAKKATDAVVHIYAEESDAMARKRYEDQKRNRAYGDTFFDDFFGDNFFGGDYFRNQNGSGSGVVYSSDGYIITNNHVVGFADSIKVTLSNGKEYKAIKIGTDPSTDLAVLKIEVDKLNTMDLANSDDIQVGEWVMAVGNPFDYLTSTVTAGIVSAKGRNINIIDTEKSIEEFIQTDAVINPGNSGGALVTTDGKLVGINTAIATPTGVYAGYSFAIPVNLVKRVVDQIITTGGDIFRVNLGVGGYDVDDSLIDELDLKVNQGFYVDKVKPSSSAKLAGILPGDIIIAIDNKDVAKFEDISNIMKFSKTGDKLKITVSRNGKRIDISTILRKSI